MLRYGYTIQVAFMIRADSRRYKRLWIVPFMVTDEEVYEHVSAGGVRVCH